MNYRKRIKSRLSEQDLDFLINTVSPMVTDKVNLKKIIREDDGYRNEYVGDGKVFRQLMCGDAIFLKISPNLFFEILLRKALKDLSNISYTIEKTLTMSIPVFDGQYLVELLTEEPILLYLAEMLSSFTRIESYTISFRIRKGVWKKIRFNDLDIHSLIRFCDVVEDHYRLALYKRIADICLFMIGVFPEFAERQFRYPHSGEVRPTIGAKLRISPEDYQKEGQRFYKLAAEHESAKELQMSDTFLALHENFHIAQKPLNFIAEHYLQYKRHTLFT